MDETDERSMPCPAHGWTCVTAQCIGEGHCIAAERVVDGVPSDTEPEDTRRRFDEREDLPGKEHDR